MSRWVCDKNDNKASVERWGSVKAAEESLTTLIDCYNCYDCSNCKEKLPAIPVLANIHQAVYLTASNEGALDMSKWHTCDTTHCRAGWVVFLAGKEGIELERKTSCLFAAMQIYKASDPKNPVSPVRFFDSDKEAMKDMKKLAKI